VLVSSASSDDAAVVRLDDGTLLVQTVDLFGPPVDDPEDYGRIAAANAISDVYAMGARPLVALNIVCFPMKTLGAAVLGEILAGGNDIAREANIAKNYTPSLYRACWIRS
jgi:selenide,water dikinase